MRKLCVDSDLAKLEETPILTFLESISGWGAAPKKKLALNSDQQPYCSNCGCYCDVVFTTCDHPFCINCIVEYLWSDNSVKCHVCRNEVKAVDSSMAQGTPSKFNTLMPLLIKDKCKSIVLCEFRKPLLKLQSALKLHNTIGKTCTTNTDYSCKEIRVWKFCNRSDIKILFATLDQLDFLSQQDLGCFSKMYIISAIPIALVQQAIALIHGPRQVEVFKVTSHTTVEGEIMGNDTGHLKEGNLIFTIEELRRLFGLG